MLGAVFCWVIGPDEAAAYIDPGSGSAIMSALIGTIVAVGLFFKTFWYKIKSLFSRGSNKEETDGR